MIEPLLSPEDVADRLNVPVRTAREYMRRMRYLRVGKHLRVTRQALDAWISRSQCETDDSTSEAATGGHESETSTAASLVFPRGVRMSAQRALGPTSGSGAPQIRPTAARPRPASGTR